MTSSRPWMIALAASAVVNVFLIGGLAGMAYARLTAAPATPAVVITPAPRVVAPPSPAPVVPVAPMEPSPKPVHHAPPRDQPTASIVATSTPPIVAASPSVDSVAQAAQARPPLISAGDVLSPDSRKAFRKALGEANKKNKPLTQQARAERQAALQAMQSPSFDAGEVAKRLSTARALDLQARGNVEAALANYAASLTLQERAMLADGLARVYTPAAARRAAFQGPPR